MATEEEDAWWHFISLCVVGGFGEVRWVVEIGSGGMLDWFDGQEV